MFLIEFTAGNAITLSSRMSRRNEMDGIKWKIVILNLIALVFLILTFTINWLFIIGAVFFSGLGYKKLMKK